MHRSLTTHLECPWSVQWCAQMASMGVACSDQTGQTGGVVEMLTVVDRVVGSSDDMLECTTMATWYSIIIRSLKSTIIRSWGIYYCYDQVFNLLTSKSANLNRAKRAHKWSAMYICRSEEEFADSPEAGNSDTPSVSASPSIPVFLAALMNASKSLPHSHPPKHPQLPHGFPSPEEEWHQNDCQYIRMIATESSLCGLHKMVPTLAGSQIDSMLLKCQRYKSVK